MLNLCIIKQRAWCIFVLRNLGIRVMSRLCCALSESWNCVPSYSRFRMDTFMLLVHACAVHAISSWVRLLWFSLIDDVGISTLATTFGFWWLQIACKLTFLGEYTYGWDCQCMHASIVAPTHNSTATRYKTRNPGV